ncbi:MAG: hypothetical protein HZA14_03975 [Nitrospirae bacterium]|nr:hypothetical protein [Nitrospirota bacterium]
MNKTLPEVITDILTYNGSLVEPDDDGALEVITTQELSETLGVPEHARLRFSYDDAGDTVFASYGSDLFISLARLFEGRGRFSLARFEAPAPNMEKLSKTLPDRISFGNAVFRFNKAEVKDVSYLLLYFKYTALSDEKHEGVLPVLINCMNMSTMPLTGGSDEIIEGLKEVLPLFDEGVGFPLPRSIATESGFAGSQRGIGIFQAAYSAAAKMAQERLKNFIRSLERRLHRDIKRVYEYYGTLREETIKMIEQNVLKLSMGDLIESELKKAMKHKNKLSKAQALKDIERIELQYLEKKTKMLNMINEKKWDFERDEKTDKLLAKLDTIETEREWKVQDLIAKYALSIRIEPVAAVGIEAQTPVFHINIKRRLASREFPVTYNPFVRQLDDLPCEACFNPHGGYYVCDDKLHIVCGDCFKTCPACGKQYCTACHKDKCPKCRK